MSRWRIVVVVMLIVLPVLFLACVGSWHLWQSGQSFTLWWPMAGCMMLGYLLAWYWQHRRELLHPIEFTPPALSTERDQKAWELIAARAQAASQLEVSQLTSPEHYLQTAQELAQELAVFYYPGSKDPVAALTLPEILSVIELASHDLHEMVERYLPGGHLLTVQDLRRARQATDWYESASMVYWLVSALISPVNTGLRYAASTVGLSQPLRMLQQNVLVWFYTAYLQRLGTYLIEVYSGRLRVGVQRYRELVLKEAAASTSDGVLPATAGKETVEVVTLALIGQVKVGKSSLINALLGEQKAFTDVLPATQGVERYTLKPEGIPSTLQLLDTVGYNQQGPSADQLQATQEAARQADLIFLVLHARNPARQVDAQVVQELRQWFAARPDLKMPPIVAVVTHIDLLTPAMEWAPPYNWQAPQRPKEQHIHQALLAVQEQLGDYLAAVVPACTAEGKLFGINEGVLPALATRLEQVRAVTVLRCLHAEKDVGKVRKVFEQMLAVGKFAAQTLWQRLSANS